MQQMVGAEEGKPPAGWMLSLEDPSLIPRQPQSQMHQRYRLGISFAYTPKVMVRLGGVVVHKPG